MMQNLNDAVLNSALIAEDDHVLVAVSGGADSMALLRVLGSMRGSTKLRVSAAHFDHCLRESSAEDGDLVARYCGRIGVDLHAGSGDVSGRAIALGESIEEAARNLRYEFLEHTAGQIGASVIATAHTRSDQVETILMRLARGAGLRGTAGIPERRGRIVRPFLDVPGDATAPYCRDHDVPFIVDVTNRDTAISRNKVRHDVLPGLRRICADVDDRLLRLGERATASLSETRRRTNPVLERARSESHGAWSIACRDVETLRDDDRVVLFGDLVTERMRLPGEVGRVHYERLVAMGRAGTPTGKRTSLPGCEVRREHDSLVFTPSTTRAHGTPRDHATELNVPGTTHVGGYDIRVDIVANSGIEPARLATIRARRGESTGADAVDVAYFARSSVGLPLVVRAPYPGDRIRPFGMRRGHKKLSDIFVDNRVPHRRRAETLVVADRQEIVWVVGVVTSESVRVEPECRDVLRVTVTPVHFQ